MKLKEITPQHLKCGILGGCPAIFKDEKGNYLIVGKNINSEASHLKLNHRIAEDEVLISIPCEYIDDIE